ncbi:unnamed protein product [Blepharisma stoltei]|uniref:Uncharacterized protein n=1 Tax=Blepharisma stoltei TaxID=1481888 RepID=A0AAU9IGJ6_9CILI|nr:unnamed protein product [Blepharisma stoltei]
MKSKIISSRLGLKTPSKQEIPTQRNNENSLHSSPAINQKKNPSGTNRNGRLDFNMLNLSERRVRASQSHRRDRSAEELFGDYNENNIIRSDSRSSSTKKIKQVSENSEIIYKSFDGTKAKPSSVIIPKVSSSREKILQINARRLKELNIKQPCESTLPKPNEAQIETISISGLKPYDDMNTLKDICKGWHIVKADLEMNDIEGKCNGKGSVQIRYFPGSGDSEKLKFHLISHGLNVSSISSVRGRKTNYVQTITRSNSESRIGLDNSVIFSSFSSSKNRLSSSREPKNDCYQDSLRSSRSKSSNNLKPRSGSASCREQFSHRGNFENLSTGPELRSFDARPSYMRETLSSQSKRRA